MYNATLSLTSALDGSGCLTPLPGRFTPGKRPGVGLGGSQGGSRGIRKIIVPPGFDSRTFQPVASHYTD